MNEIEQLRELVTNLREDLAIAQANSVVEANSRLQMKVDRQRRALDILNRKVLSQRFRLRLLNELGRDVTREEYLAAKERLENEQTQARILDYAPVA